VLVILQNGCGSRYAGMLRWGLIPPWAKDPAIGNRTINISSKTAHKSHPS
jgi:putative SOS response-associated peptidase YedK